MNAKERARRIAEVPPGLWDELQQLAPLGRALLEADDERVALGEFDDHEREPTKAEAIARCAAVLFGDVPTTREDPQVTRLRAKLAAVERQLAELRAAVARGSE